MTCYGSYVDTFFDYCLPSLMAQGNLPTLCKHFEVGFVIHTDKESAPRFKELKAALFHDITDGDKYEMTGKHQNHDLTLAKILGADYHLCMPDFIYSENCFAGVIKAIERGHKAIARLVVSTVKEDITPELNRPRSAIDLATLSLQHMHPGIQNWRATKDGYYPNTHVLAWETKDRLRMCSPHMTPVYIANEAIDACSNYPLDSILDIVVAGDIYLPQPEDDMVIIEISPRDGRKPEETRVDLKEFNRIFQWDTRSSKKQLQLFQQETVDAIRGSGEWNDVEISEQKAIVRHALENG